MRKLLVLLICLVPFAALAEPLQFFIYNNTSDIAISSTGQVIIPPHMARGFFDLSNFGALLAPSKTMHWGGFICKPNGAGKNGTGVRIWVDERVGVTQIDTNTCTVNGVKYAVSLQPGMWGSVTVSDFPVQNK